MSIVAQRYTKAIFELARDEGELESVDTQLASLAELWRKSTSLRDVFIIQALMLSNDATSSKS